MAETKTSILFTEQQVQNRISELARQLNNKFQGRTLIAIGVLKGAFMFYADLIRQLTCSVICDFCATSSYGQQDTPSQEIRLTMDIKLDVSAHHILLIEDIVDRGLTLKFLQQMINSRHPKSLTTVTLVAKPQTIKPPCPVDYVGFHVDRSAFIVGYGMDYKEKHRHLPYLAKITKL